MEKRNAGGNHDSTEHHTRGRHTGKVKGASKKTTTISPHKQTSEGAFQRGSETQAEREKEPSRLRPKTSGGIVRQLILQAENQLAQKRSDIEFLEGQLQQFRAMLAEWESGVSAIESNQEEK